MLKLHHQTREFESHKHSSFFFLTLNYFEECFETTIKYVSYNIKQQSLKSNKHSNLFFLRMNDFEECFEISIKYVSHNFK
jgi:hypothetical protein